jgi:hypothetical protein
VVGAIYNDEIIRAVQQEEVVASQIYSVPVITECICVALDGIVSGFKGNAGLEVSR